jgi:hypothetical protein
MHGVRAWLRRRFALLGPAWPLLGASRHLEVPETCADHINAFIAQQESPNGPGALE